MLRKGFLSGLFARAGASDGGGLFAEGAARRSFGGLELPTSAVVFLSCIVLSIGGSYRPQKDDTTLDRLFSVFGRDERAPFDVSARPWAAIGRLELHDPGVTPDKPKGVFSICTGTLVWSDIVLTNAHCILDTETGTLKQTKKVWFRPGYQRGKALADAYMTEAWYGTSHPDDHRADDWALMRISKPLGNQVGWLPVRAASEDNPLTMSSLGLAFVAYGSDYRSGNVATLQRHCLLTVFEPRYGYFRHDCDMNSGASGGPMILTGGGSPHIVAINAAHTSREAISYYKDFTASRANVAVSSIRFLPKLRELIARSTESMVEAVAPRSH